MKRLTLLSIGLAIALAGCIVIGSPSNIRGSGIAMTETRTLASFDSLDVEFVGSIAVRSQGQESLAISGDDNIIPFITTEVKNGTLYIRSSKGYSPQQKLQIVVSTTNVKRFVFDGVGEANLSNLRTGQKIKRDRKLVSIEIEVKTGMAEEVQTKAKETSIRTTMFFNFDRIEHI